MKKYLSIIFILVISLFCLSGCDGLYSGLRGNVTIDYKNGGKADVSVMYAFKGLPKEYSVWFDDEEKIRGTGKLGAFEDWEYELYEQDEFIGFSFIKRDVEFSSLDDLFEAMKEDNADDTSTVTLERKGQNYVFYCKLDESDALSRKSMELAKEISDIEFTFVVKVPFKVINSNATSVSEDGKILEWDLLAMDEDTLHAEFFVDTGDDQTEKTDSPDLMIIVGIATAAFFLICLVIAFILRKKRF